MNVLILASNPRKDLSLGTEIRDLKAVINASRNHREFQVEDALAVRVGDLQDLLFRHEPQIVHFCGHGSGQQGLVFEGHDGGEQWLRTEAIADLFRLFANNVGCVLLNACYSEDQASAIVNHIDYVIGMNQAIRDDAAIAFAKGFYRALGYACSIEEAFEFGKNAIQLEISGSSKVRSGATDQMRKAEVVTTIAQTTIPEHLKPILKIKSTLTSPLQPSRSVPAPDLPQETRAAIQLDIDKSLDGDSAEQFRDQVREYLSDRKLSPLERVRLELLREKLRLTKAEADRIIAEEMEPIQRSQADYVATLEGLIEAGHYPFDAETEAELQTLRQALALTEEELTNLAPPILAAAEAAYQASLAQAQQQEHDQNIQRYTQEFSRALAAGYPLDDTIRAGLTRFQQSLELSDEDVTRIEAPLIAPKAAEYQRQQAQARQQELERQQQLEKQRRQEAEAAANRQPPLQRAEFQVPTVKIVENLVDQVIEKPGWFGKKTEVIKTSQKNCHISYQRGQADYFVEALGQGVTLDMVAIPGGTFMMGSPSQEEGRDLYGQIVDALKGVNVEGPEHLVNIQPFYMGKYAVTQTQWFTVAHLPKVKIDLQPDPAHFKGTNRPVETVSWFEATEFCDRLTQYTGRPYRLPSEAEWEYACRGGTKTPFYCGDTITTDLANYNGNYTYGAGVKGVYREQTTEVGTFSPNAFGLYDMHGNVWEWCLDPWHNSYQGAPIDGSAWMMSGTDKLVLMRGSSWYNDPWYCRSAFRNYNYPVYQNSLVGLRVVCV